MPEHVNFACLALALLDVKLVFTVSVIYGCCDNVHLLYERTAYLQPSVIYEAHILHHDL